MTMTIRAAACVALVHGGLGISLNDEQAEAAYKRFQSGDEEGFLAELGLGDGLGQHQKANEGPRIEGPPSNVRPTPRDAASLLQRAERAQRRACSCLPWATVYKEHGVTCGQGMEFYAWLGNKEALAANDPKLAEVRYNLEDEFCTKFFERMETNRAVRMKFNTPPSEHEKEWDQSWCYVSSECGEDDLNGGGYVPGKPVHWKIARTENDVVLSEMNPSALMHVSQHENQNTGYDMGVLGGYAYYLSMGEDQENLSEAMLKEAGKTSLTTILQPANHLAPRMIVKGVQNWKFHQNTGHQTAAPGSWWTGFKVE